MTSNLNSSFVRLQRRIGQFPIEFPAAALMAIAVAFVTMALPAWRFQSLVGASGLPALLSAAQPPLGQTARLLVALILGSLSFAAVWAGLRALDDKPEPDDFPVFRTADLHPDAPRRRPILADAEFGPPASVEPAAADQPRRRSLVSESLPSFLAPQPAAIGDFDHSVQDAPFEDDIDDGPAPPPLLRAKPIVRVAPVAKPEVPEAAPIVETAPPVVVAATEPVPAFMQPHAPLSIVPSDVAEPKTSADDSVSTLMARLESGLARKGSRPEPGAAGPAQDELLRTLDDFERSSRRSRS